ncbi:MAG: N-acetylmuramic acid 6-phosphate etherase [Firmicutes bacterium]|nr:N-acetylmuramic acid 6-phosphate etherase [Candidatus Fermentithermobacillaceae bacterium]
MNNRNLGETFVPRTENSNPLTRDIDTWPLRKILEVMNCEDHRIAPAIAREIPRIQEAVEMVVECLSKGGRLFYIGAGTSGRLGILDAAELNPTFGLPKDKAIAIISGGKEAVFSAIEGAEDSEGDGKQALLSYDPGPRDAVVGITASGKTPFVLGAMEAARSCGCKTIAIVGDPRGPVAGSAQVTISPDVGPEVITGSTRLKNGTAQKMVLNMISTAAMIRLGRTYSNLMAGTSPTNLKLSSRARRILREATRREPEQLQAALEQADGEIAPALIMLTAEVSADEARCALERASGSIREALRLAMEGIPECRESHEPAPAVEAAGKTLHGEFCERPSAKPQAGLYFGTPEEAGFSAKRLERAFRVVSQAVGDGQGPIPGAVAVVIRHNAVIGPRAWGWAVRTPERIPVTPDTIFDMASLTKVMAATPSVLILCERGKFRLDDPVAIFIPEFGAHGKDAITIRHLLTHTSGLPDHIKFWKEGLRGKQIVDKICSLEIAEGRRPGKQVIYSDLGFILLGEIVQRVTGMDIKQFAEEEVFRPLGMYDTCFLPPESLKHRIAATEYREDFARVMWGEVHDENAHALRGIAGHAGLFSTALDTAKYALMWLNNGRWGDTRILGKSTVSAATKEQANLEERRCLGWMLKSKTFSSGGDFLSDMAYGHTGFTGTSLWCDPAYDLAVILLTNRVHAGREGNAHIRLRATFANAVAAAIDRD